MAPHQAILEAAMVRAPLAGDEVEIVQPAQIGA
jgi:hypothetical protein